MLFLIGSPAQAQGNPTVRPWWIGLELGDGQTKLTSDQNQGSRTAAFALGFVGGHSLGNQARLGLELNGWLLQAFDLSDPTVGEAVSNVLVVVDAFPIRRSPLFVRAGAGAAMYENRRPGRFGGSGWSWTAGAGYEIRVGEKFSLAPLVDYATGSLGDVRNAVTVETGRRYSVVEFKLDAILHFGRPQR